MAKRQSRVPRFEPEVIAAGKRKQWGDIEKVATTAVKRMIVNGVELSSRYDKADEYEAMAAIVRQLPVSLLPLIASVFCDSKAIACYSVQLRDCSRRQALAVGDHFDHACVEAAGGHNGLLLCGTQGGNLFVDPNWPGDEAYFAGDRVSR